MTQKMAEKILFVCLGNICRSPAAEAVFKSLADGTGITCDSAATGDWHTGEPPYGPMIAAAAARGVKMDDLRARTVTPRDFELFDLIVAMDGKNRSTLEAMRPAFNTTPVHQFLEFAGRPGAEVPDPYYTRDFDGALDLIEEAATGLLARLTGDQRQ